MKVNVKASFCSRWADSVFVAFETGARITSLGIFFWGCLESKTTSYYGFMFLVLIDVLSFYILFIVRQYTGIHALREYYESLTVDYTAQTKGIGEGIWTGWVGLWSNVAVPS
eukprot:CAMPEP_0204842652 /NCGR_PEP_ID=MMETSP1346-20131115/47483_1 /ASSEMBLY_ACC=CAM_ASM_000771 /TAXON_ID=215587 /ORGANISM="Aplanochytrium stocchinoi, Strain GSBS06" /LENGTH=111 /DNA_ID=CAMNT_0051981651 /DNA_START=53 /DNA_END=385 /DNA_ORIENTATION=+